ncbi:MAG: hydrogenase maturation nickel metallochaperone HypA [Rhodothermales bacterium]|nr:hydrogenase maturation nickel metallochaperone HypA [Rhodothermales bacterium]
MHELSIAQSILDALLTEKQARDLDRIDSVMVHVGALSGVLPDALEFSFEAIRIDTELEQCKLQIETIPITVACRTCGQTNTVEDFLFLCPACESVHVDVEAGYELEIAYIEVPDSIEEPVP